MAIRPVSGVSFSTNLKQINFEGKKETPLYENSSVKNTLKAIPLATLIAMSPLTTKAEEKVVVEHIVENADPISGRSAQVIYYDTDGDPTYTENMVFKFYDEHTYSETVNGKKVNKTSTIVTKVDLDSVFVERVTEKFANGPDRKFVRYYISGPAIIASTDVKTPNIPKSGKPKKFEVTENVYNYLKHILGSDIPQKITNVVEDGDLNEELDYYGY